jgi:glycosyltransferase involved in cell wall biosynthesis
MTTRKILLFADRLPPLTGGMEVHAQRMIEHFTNHPRYPLAGVVTKEGEEFPERLDPSFLFFNSGRWIEELDDLKRRFPRAKFLYRTGGNEIIKAPLIREKIDDHRARQSFWVENLNRTIDVLLTNSVYTEARLKDLGITCCCRRYVGGASRRRQLAIFCAARFVPYKNHSLLLSVVRELVARGHCLSLRLAGEGPLLQQLKGQVERSGLGNVVTFLGPLSNDEVVEEMVRADAYVQLSGDRVTEVPGGSYVHSEGMGRSILEAITAGTFVIAGNSGALPEIITADRGTLVELGDVDAVTDQVERAITLQAVRGRGCDDYSWDNLFSQYEQLLEVTD